MMCARDDGHRLALAKKQANKKPVWITGERCVKRFNLMLETAITAIQLHVNRET